MTLFLLLWALGATAMLVVQNWDRIGPALTRGRARWIAWRARVRPP